MIEIRDGIREDCMEVYPMVKAMIHEWTQMTIDPWPLKGCARGFERLIFDEKGARLAVALVDGKICGYVFFTNSASSLNCMTSLTMENFYVKPEYRRKGVGSEMYRFMQKKTIEEGRLGLEWFSVARRSGDNCFFEKMGGRPGEVRFTYHWNNGIEAPENPAEE